MILPETSNIQALMDYFSFATWSIYFLTFLGSGLYVLISSIVSRARQSNPFKD